MKNQDNETGSINIIGAGTSIEGEIISNGDIRIDGKLKGTLTTKGKLVVGPNGIIEGEINCKSCDMSGKIDGKLFIQELLSLKATAKVRGEVTTGKLTVEVGAILTGTVNMDGNAPSGSGLKIEQLGKK